MGQLEWDSHPAPRRIGGRRAVAVHKVSTALKMSHKRLSVSIGAPLLAQEQNPFPSVIDCVGWKKKQLSQDEGESRYCFLGGGVVQWISGWAAGAVPRTLVLARLAW
jgi:hypothetical protein